MNVQMTQASTLPNLATFCAAFELGSFSLAARRLGVTPQAASRSVARLEEALGVTLFRRTTRSLTPTQAAREYYHTAHQALVLLTRAEQALKRDDKATSGVVRLSAPTTFGHHRLLPSLAAFRERYPSIELDLHIGNRNVDFVREGFDFAVRLGQIREYGLVARKLGDFAIFAVCPSRTAKSNPSFTKSRLRGRQCPKSSSMLRITFTKGTASDGNKRWCPKVVEINRVERLRSWRCRRV